MVLVLARMSVWNFKKGKREEAFAELDRILNSNTRNTSGFRGYISLLSYENANTAMILTLWKDKESLEASEKGVFAVAINKIKDSIEGDPSLMNYRVFSTELFNRKE
jgi:heme-degrading monooxygenase HmoA